MFDNQNYPWYLQQRGNFKTIYDGMFPIVSMASPLGIEDAFNVDQLAGLGLLYFGQMWGLRGMWGAVTDGMIYDIDKWSTDKKWSGEFQDLNAKIYRQFIKMNAYINGKNYTLGLIQEALAILLEGQDYSITVDEGFMNFTINLTAPSEVLNIMYNMQRYDNQFLGKPSGISYSFKYIVKNNQEEQA